MASVSRSRRFADDQWEANPRQPSPFDVESLKCASGIGPVPLSKLAPQERPHMPCADAGLSPRNKGPGRPRSPLGPEERVRVRPQAQAETRTHLPLEGHRPGGPLPGRRSTGRDHDRFAELEEDPAARSVDGLGDAGGMLQLYGSKPFDRRFPRESLTISSELREHPRRVLRLKGYKTTGEP